MNLLCRFVVVVVVVFFLHCVAAAIAALCFFLYFTFPCIPFPHSTLFINKFCVRFVCVYVREPSHIGFYVLCFLLQLLVCFLLTSLSSIPLSEMFMVLASLFHLWSHFFFFIVCFGIFNACRKHLCFICACVRACARESAIDNREN